MIFYIDKLRLFETLWDISVKFVLLDIGLPVRSQLGGLWCHPSTYWFLLYVYVQAMASSLFYIDVSSTLEVPQFVREVKGPYLFHS